MNPPPAAEPTRPPRRRDSAASRQDLLDAARTLFGDRGYERTTLRDIGSRAGVDPALVARYFGSKAALYAATIDADNEAAGVHPVTDLHAMVALVLRRVEDKGVGPLMQALLQPQTDDDTRALASAHLRHRLIDPLAARLEAAGETTVRAKVRAEAAVAAVLGIACIRGLGGFDALRDVDCDELIAAVSDGLAPLVTPSDSP